MGVARDASAQSLQQARAVTELVGFDSHSIHDREVKIAHGRVFGRANPATTPAATTASPTSKAAWQRTSLLERNAVRA